MTSIATLGFTPGNIVNVVLLGFGAAGEVPEPEEQEGVSGGWLSPEQARAVLRKIHRKRAEKARRAEELEAAIEEAEETGNPEPVRKIIERDTGPIVLAVQSLQAALAQMALIDQQFAAINQRRMDDAAVVLLLTEI